MKITYLLGLILAGLFSISSTKAQCTSLMEKKCYLELKPYVSNGQINSAKLGPGESASLTVNLYKSLSYRLLICSENVIENTQFSLMNQDSTVLFTDTLREDVVFKDVEVGRSQMLLLTVKTPEAKNTSDAEQNACVAIFVGFK